MSPQFSHNTFYYGSIMRNELWPVHQPHSSVPDIKEPSPRGLRRRWVLSCSGESTILPVRARNQDWQPTTLIIPLRSIKALTDLLPLWYIPVTVLVVKKKKKIKKHVGRVLSGRVGNYLFEIYLRCHLIPVVISRHSDMESIESRLLSSLLVNECMLIISTSSASE